MKHLVFFFIAALLFIPPVHADITVTNPGGTDRVVTTRELACIAHIVVDAEAWARHAASVDILWAIQEKADKWCPRMDSEKTLTGPNYRTRADCDLITRENHNLESRRACGR